MDQATHSVPAGFMWPTVGHPGRVPLWALVGDPEQPRKHFDDDELDALASTMKGENGGEQREILTVSELDEEERVPLAPARYKIVSGERRWRAATRANLPDVEIRVKAYESKPKRKLDMYMLNEGRVQLSDIEDARYLAELMYDFDLTSDDELAALTGKTKSHITTHLALLRLVPEVQALMEPKIPERSRLRMGTALTLSRLDRSVQADYAERMPKGDGVSVRRQVDWIKAEIARTGAETRTRELTPGTVRRSIEYLSEMTGKRVDEIFAHKAFERIFDKATPAHKEILLGSVKKMLGKVEKLLDRIEAQLPSQTPAPKPVERSVQARAPAPPPPPAPKPAAQAPASKPKPVVAPDHKATAAAFLQSRTKAQQTPAREARAPVRVVHTPAPQRPQPPAPVVRAAPAPAPQANTAWKEKAVTFMGPVGRMVTDKVSQRKYLELWDKKQLKFQIEGKERPEWMPTREAAEQDWNKYCE